MIYGYAIEPSALIKWAKNISDFEFFIENDDKFGYGNSRVLIEFPKFKNWKKQYLESLNNASEDERIRLEQTYKKFIIEGPIVKHSFEYNGNISWLDNALIDANREMFKAIIAEENPNNKPYVLKRDLRREWAAKYWKIEEERIIPRKAQCFADAIYPMIRNSKKVCFIDPYLNLDKLQWYSTFKTIFDKISYDNRKDFTKVVFEIHISADIYKSQERQYYKECNMKKLQEILPKGVTVTVFRWKQRGNGEKLHNRYVLTDIGGVKFSTGLDEGKQGETEEIALMRKKPYQIRWEQYNSESPAFDLDFKFSVSK